MSKPANTEPAWEVRQDPRDPNAWDVYQGANKIAHMPWQSKANAEFIVRAVNSHDELFAVLKAVQDGVDSWNLGHDLATRLDAAIAKAEAK